MRNLRRGSGQSLAPDTIETCLKVLRDVQVQLPVSRAEAAAVGQLCTWLGAFAGGASLSRAGTAVEALDDPRSFLAAREHSGSDMGCGLHSSPDRDSVRVSSGRLSRPSLLPDDGEMLQQLRASSGSFTSSSSSSSPALEEQMQLLLDWNGFDVFSVARLSRGRPLQTVTWGLLNHFGLVDSLSLPQAELRSFLKVLEASYNDNPYHNSRHAADVTQNVGVMLAANDLASQLSQLEVLAMILAAAVHDVRHPGFGNAYMVNTSTEAAVTWNDISVNENMHAATAFRMLSQPQNNFLVGLEPDEYRFLRRTVIGIVLATDMASHADLVADFSANVALLGEGLGRWPAEKRMLALSMVVHCADLGNPGKPLRLSLNWSARITKEFFAQGDAERAAGLPISRLCDRTDADVGASQVSFIEAVVQPTFKTLAALVPNTATLALANSEKALQHWKSGAVSWRAWLSPSHDDFEPHLDGLDASSEQGAAKPSPDALC